MRNCFFENDDFTTTVRPASFIKEDNRGYFIDIKINKTDVVKFMMLGLVPTYHADEDIFTLSVALNNNTKIRINGIRATSLNLDDNRLQQIPLSLISIRELALRQYSKKTDYKSQQCYATKAIFHINTPSRSRKKNANSKSS